MLWKRTLIDLIVVPCFCSSFVYWLYSAAVAISQRYWGVKEAEIFIADIPCIVVWRLRWNLLMKWNIPFMLICQLKTIPGPALAVGKAFLIVTWQFFLLHWSLTIIHSVGKALTHIHIAGFSPAWQEWRSARQTEVYCNFCNIHRPITITEFH